MGVHGLWRLIEPSGKPVPLETLENKVLAVDISIWLHQAIKGFQDSKGAPLPNAHLLGIYHRVCKLLYFKIKPVFVFDGGVPVLKRETIAKRNQLRAHHTSDANKIQKQILNTLLKHTAISKVLSEQTKSQLPVKQPKPQDLQNDDDLFKLPPSQLDSTISSSDDEDYTSKSDSSPTKYWDIHTIDEKSAEFRSLPADVRHEILTDLKETRKQSSWGRIHELPTESNEFSGYQMKRLLKRFSIQSSLEETEKEMGGHSLSMKELESLLNDHGVVTGDTVGNRIASDENTRYLYIKDVKKALEKARLENLKPIIEEESEIIDTTNSPKDKIKENNSLENSEITNSPKDCLYTNIKENELHEIACSSKENLELIDNLKDDLEYQRDLNLAIQLSLQENASSSNAHFGESSLKSKTKVSSIQKNNNLKKFSAAMGYMMEYGGLTPAGANEILMGKHQPEENFQSDEEKSIISKLLEEDISSLNLLVTDNNAQNCDNAISMNSSKLHMTKDSDKKSEGGSGKSLGNVESIVIEDDEKCCTLNTKEKRLSIEGESNNQINKTVTKTVELCTNTDSKKTSTVDSNSESDDDFLEVPESVKSNSSDDDFVEVPEEKVLKESKETVASSESEDDFLEVPQKGSDKMLEVVIDKNKREEDDEDIFSDIFSENKEKPILIDLHKIIEQNNKVETKNFEKQNNVQSIEKTASVDLSKLMDGKSEKKKVQFSLKTDEKDINVDEGTKLSINKDKGLDNVREEKNVINEEEIISIDKTEKGVKDIIKEDKVVQTKVVPKLNTDELRQMQQYLEQEQESLIAQRSNKERLANNITDQMYQEAQELLRLFGVPYIIAPMEAEAQCAFLNEANLTDGTITDDSDIWLFGGKTVYKNFFNQNKRVLEFRSENIEHHFNLTRLKLIQLSLLVGSDYTVGLQGIGPVTALEILAAFPSYNENASLSYQQVISGLIRFRNWFKEGRIAGPGKAALRTKLRNLEVTESFPNPNVAKAYIEPEVENSKEHFSWGKPDIITLTDYAKQKFGWSQKKSEEILKPVVKRLQESKIQSTIKDYFKTKHKIDVTDLSERMSKRVKSAVNRMGKGDETDNSEEVIPKENKSRGRKKKIVEGNLEDCKNPKNSKRSVIESVIKEVDQSEENVTDLSERMSKRVKSVVNRMGKGDETDNSEEVIPKENKSRGRKKKIVEGNLEDCKNPKNSKRSVKESVIKEVDQSEENEKELKTNSSVNETEKLINANIEENELIQNSTVKVCEKLTVPRTRYTKKPKQIQKKPLNKLDEIRNNLTKTRKAIQTLKKVDTKIEIDEDLLELHKVEIASTSKVKEIEESVKRDLEKNLKRTLHAKEVIHQKVRDKSEMVRSKMRAIETFRKSKSGPGYVKKRAKVVRKPKDDAELSEESSDD